MANAGTPGGRLDALRAKASVTSRTLVCRRSPSSLSNVGSFRRRSWSHPTTRNSAPLDRGCKSGRPSSSGRYHSGGRRCARRRTGLGRLPDDDSAGPPKGIPEKCPQSTRCRAFCSVVLPQVPDSGRACLRSGPDCWVAGWHPGSEGRGCSREPPKSTGSTWSCMSNAIWLVPFQGKAQAPRWSCKCPRVSSSPASSVLLVPSWMSSSRCRTLPTSAPGNRFWFSTW